MKHKEIKACRVCQNPDLISILDLGNLFISDFVKEQPPQDYRAPLELVLCAHCNLLQLKHTANQDAMYANYWYLSGLNESMVKSLTEITDRIKETINLKAGDLVLDIGCNDGTLLKTYRIDGLKLVGMDPAKNLKELSEKIATKVIVDYFNFEAFNKHFPNEKAQAITSIAMFYDLDDPNSFVADIKKTLAEKGLWIIQMNYLPSMLENNSLDNICHEHLEYYSLKSLDYLLKQHDLEIFNAELNDVNGGSYRIYVKHKNNPNLKVNRENIKKLEDWENRLGLSQKEVYLEFASRCAKIKKDIVEFIRSENRKGKQTFVYGASTKGNTILQYFGLTKEDVPFALERNPTKYGLKTVGSDIPIISEEEGRHKKPAYLFVMPYHFINVFVEREKEFLKNGGKFILPFPEFKLIGDGGQD